MLLTVINSHFLFKFNNKNKFYYFFSTIALLYTHFYASFFVFYNLLVGSLIFKKNKLKIFIISNGIAFLTFLPLLIYKKQSLTSDFNSWMKIPRLEDYLASIDVFVGNYLIGIIFIVFIVFLYKKINKKSEKLFLNYNFFLIITIFILATLFSYLIKPIYCYRYFYIAYPSYLALVTMIICHFCKIKLKAIVPIVVLLLLTVNSRVNYQNLFCNHNLFLNYIKHDLNTHKSNYVFMSDTVEKYNDFKIDGVKMVYVPINKGINALDFKENSFEKDSNFYVLNLYLSDEVYKTAKKITLFKTVLGVFCKVEL